MSKQSFIDKCIKDKDGKVVLGQKPNLPIIVWFITLVINQFANGRLYTVADLIGFGALFTWGWLELFDGVNYLRRVFGLLVLLGLLYSRIY
jgi:hypothetical protein